MKWYKHDPSAALAGMIGLTVEERGAYYTLMDLQYARAPHNDVTDELVVKALGVRPHTWRRLKASLMAKGKVHEINGSITANRVLNQISTAVQNGLLGGHIEENQSPSNGVADQSGPGESKESRIESFSSFPTAARESQKRKKKNRSARSLATAPNGGALTREPKTVTVTPSLAEIIQAKGWKE
jgi:hypothetical protein